MSQSRSEGICLLTNQLLSPGGARPLRYVRPWAVRRFRLCERVHAPKRRGVRVGEYIWVSLGHAKREWTLTLFCRGASVGAQRRRRRHRVGERLVPPATGRAVGPGPTRSRASGGGRRVRRVAGSWSWRARCGVGASFVGWGEWCGAIPGGLAASGRMIFACDRRDNLSVVSAFCGPCRQ